MPNSRLYGLSNAPAPIARIERVGAGHDRRTTDMPAQTCLFMCLKDNFGVLIHDPESGATAAIDAPEAGPVEAALERMGWRLTDILVTHHHRDHTDGIEELKAHYHCRVVAPAAEAGGIPDVDEAVRENDIVHVGGLEARVIETPGHTAGHISYFFEADKLVFAGDTLFSIGCGRVIEGNAQMMWDSLLKLRALPDDTRVFCGHEYTAANIRFAKSIEPDNPTLLAREDEIERLNVERKPTIPSFIGEEKAANPFLRADVPAVAEAVGLAGKPAWEVFAEIRQRKNTF
jgi:hydroxyacylglutathione hydrolase